MGCSGRLKSLVKGTSLVSPAHVVARSSLGNGEGAARFLALKIAAVVNENPRATSHNEWALIALLP
jgi:hypothetical protein